MDHDCDRTCCGKVAFTSGPPEIANADLERDGPEYDGDIDDGARTLGAAAGPGIIGINPT